MTAELYGSIAPNSQSFVLAHLLPLAGDWGHLGAKSWTTGMVLPYRMVTLIPGPSDLISSYSTVRTHTFAKTFTEANNEAWNTHRRMLVLADDPLTNVVMSDGSIANCEWLEVSEEPHEEPYAAESVVTRFVSEYHLGLHFGPVAAP